MYAHDGRLHFHRPFLDRLTNRKPDAPCALAAFLLLNVIDEMRQPGFDADAVNLRINAVFNPLGQAPAGDPQVFHLVRLAERLRQVVSTRDVASITPDVLGYANWLIASSRFPDALSVLDCAVNASPVDASLAIANLHFRRGFTLRQTAQLDSAAEAYEIAVRAANSHGDAELELLARVGLAKTWRMMGTQAKSSAALRDIDREATDARLAFTQACARHDLAVEQDVAPKQALTLTVQAFDLYEDFLSRRRCLADLAYMLARFGYFSAAKKCFLLLPEDDGTAFCASVLGTKIWIAFQTHNRADFDRLKVQSGGFDEDLATSTEMDINLRLAQGHMMFDQLNESRDYFHRTLHAASKLRGSPLYEEIETTRDVINGARPISAISVNTLQEPALAALVGRLEKRLSTALRRRNPGHENLISLSFG